MRANGNGQLLQQIVVRVVLVANKNTDFSRTSTVTQTHKQIPSSLSDPTATRLNLDDVLMILSESGITQWE